jgi:hypothetical protein
LANSISPGQLATSWLGQQAETGDSNENLRRFTTAAEGISRIIREERRNPTRFIIH